MVLSFPVIPFVPAYVPGSSVNLPASNRNLEFIQDRQGTVYTLPRPLAVPFRPGHSRVDLPGECSQVGIRDRESGLQEAIRLAPGVRDVTSAQARFRRSQFGMHTPVPMQEEFGRDLIIADFRKRFACLFVISP